MSYFTYNQQSMHRLYDAYIARDIIKLYAPQSFGGYVFYPYHVCSSDGTPLSHHSDEAAAIAAAESRAKATPGHTYYVTKAVAKSHVTPPPTITTRL